MGEKNKYIYRTLSFQTSVGSLQSVYPQHPPSLPAVTGNLPLQRRASGRLRCLHSWVLRICSLWRQIWPFTLDATHQNVRAGHLRVLSVRLLSCSSHAAFFFLPLHQRYRICTQPVDDDCDDKYFNHPQRSEWNIQDLKLSQIKKFKKSSWKLDIYMKMQDLYSHFASATKFWWASRLTHREKYASFCFYRNIAHISKFKKTNIKYTKHM